ncbi:MAG: DNA adenine methylase [Gemmatimonadales bacterium]
MDSFIRWAGSKRSLIPELAQHYPTTTRRYVEPFAGSAALFFRLAPQRALLCDLNRDLVTTLRAVTRDPGLVLESFRRLPRGARAFYRVRSQDTADLSDAQRAAIFIYLNRYCFNGLYRTNAAGKFNVPYGPPTKPLHAFEQRVREAAQHLAHATIKAQDFRVTLGEVRDRDFVYVDPPYVTDERRIFSEYLPGTFSRADLADLLAALERTADVGATFLLSYADVHEVRAFARSWHVRQVVTRRNVAGFSGNRRTVAEVLISNTPLTTSRP